LSVTLRTKKEIEALREANKVVVEVLHDLRAFTRAGMSTLELEQRAGKLLARTKAKPAFLGYRGYPAIICISLNEEVVHGIPSPAKIIKEGDIVSIDFGVDLKGWYGDAAFTFPVGTVDQEKKRLLEVTEECLNRAVRVLCPGHRLSDIARAVQDHAEANGFSVVYKFVGHGIGRQMHEDPQVPNCGSPRPDVKLRKGMVLALEPMINAGEPHVQVLEDGWTAVTTDGRPSAHFERSVAVGEDGPEVLSAWSL
jgi:methionyl aminopeptidase